MNTQNTSNHRAFTLIELLIVVAIIAILASIAVPNFLEAQVRAKVAATKADMRTMATALELYAIDHNTYPLRTGSQDVNTTSFPVFPDATFRLEDMRVLTTPISYIGSLPRDIFESTISDPGIPNWNTEDNLIDYWPSLYVHEIIHRADLINNTTYSSSIPWMLVSVGPDGRMGHERASNKLPKYSNLQIDYRSEYDATNGTTSRGNIYRLRVQENPQQFLNNLNYFD
ncbi:MAG: type IV pilin protein [Sumerlaeia bacterium]